MPSDESFESEPAQGRWQMVVLPIVVLLVVIGVITVLVLTGVVQGQAERGAPVDSPTTVPTIEIRP